MEPVETRGRGECSVGTPGCRLGAGVGRRPPGTRGGSVRSRRGPPPTPEPGDASVRSRRGHPRTPEAGDPSVRSRREPPPVPEPGDVSVRSRTPHHPEPRGASVRSRGGDPQGRPRLEGPQVPGGGYRQGARPPRPPPVSGMPYSSSLWPGIWICGPGGPASQA